MISVCLASYNGAAQIRRQLESILPQLGETDEIIVSDDGSTDGTVEVVRALGDSRIRLLDGPHEGVLRNFENAIAAARGDYIFLSDQDDEWLPNKVERVLDAFSRTNSPIVMHDAVVVDEDGSVLFPSLSRYRGVRHGIFLNIVKNSYVGSCMAFRASLKEKLFPFRGSRLGGLHDTWIGLIGELNGGFYFLDEILFRYYRYSTSVTSQFLRPSPWWRQILKRVLIVCSLIAYFFSRRTQ